MNNVSVHYLDQYSLNNNSLEETESEFWHHKVVKPSFEYFSLSEDSDSIPEGIQTYIKYLESQGEEIFPKNIGIQSRTYSRDVTMFGKLTYQTHLGTTTHYMRLYAYANMYYPQGTTNLNTGIRVENISMQLPDGSWLNGQSNLEAGRASHLSVATLVSTYPNQSNEASYISTLHWDGGYFYRSGSDLSFSISLQRGPLTATANYTTQNLTRNYSKLVNIYEAGPNYPREAKSEFDRTFLREIDQGYTINYSIVTHAPLDTQRALRVRFYVPFYDKLQIGKSGHVDNATEDLYIYYK